MCPCLPAHEASCPARCSPGVPLLFAPPRPLPPSLLTPPGTCSLNPPHHLCPPLTHTYVTPPATSSSKQSGVVEVAVNYAHQPLSVDPVLRTAVMAELCKVGGRCLVGCQGFRVSGFQGAGFRVSGSRVSGFGVPGCRLQGFRGAGCRIQGLGFQGCRVQDSGLGLWGSGSSCQLRPTHPCLLPACLPAAASCAAGWRGHRGRMRGRGPGH